MRASWRSASSRRHCSRQARPVSNASPASIASLSGKSSLRESSSAPRRVRCWDAIERCSRESASPLWASCRIEPGLRA
jgi:hypothetical protein